MGPWLNRALDQKTPEPASVRPKILAGGSETRTVGLLNVVYRCPGCHPVTRDDATLPNRSPRPGPTQARTSAWAPNPYPPQSHLRLAPGLPSWYPSRARAWPDDAQDARLTAQFRVRLLGDDGTGPRRWAGRFGGSLVGHERAQSPTRLVSR